MAEKKKTEMPYKISRKEVPDVGDLVIGTVTKMFKHGVYVSLDEYGGMEAYAPASEIVSSWFHSVKDYLRQNQKAVFRVIRVDPRRKLIDVSLRRVSDEERKEKFKWWKRTLRAVKLFELVSQRVGVPAQELIERVGWRFEDRFGDMLRGFEEIAKGNIDVEDVVKTFGVSIDIARAIKEVSVERIEIPEITISSIVRVLSLKRGVDDVKEVLLSVYDVAKKYEGSVKVRVYTIGPPRYKVDVTGRDPKLLEKVVGEIADCVVKKAKERGCEVSVTRVKTS